MGTHSYATSPTPHITVETCGGDLSIEGTSETGVTFEFDEGDGQVEREGETLRLTTSGDCRITCPPASSITLQHVSGDFDAGDLTSTLAVESVGGAVSLRGAGVVTVNSTRSDLSARDMSGDLRIGSVGSDAEVRRIDGNLRIDRIDGDLSARHLQGDMVIESVGGDASIETDILAGKTYRINAGGDLTLRVPPDASARFTLKANGEIEDRIELSDWKGDSHAGQGIAGSGEAQVELSAGGDLALLPVRTGIDFNVNFEAIDGQIEAKMAQFEREMETKMRELGEHIARMAALGAGDIESRLRRVDVERITHRAQQAAERAQRRAQQAAARARAQAERAAERAQRSAERRGKRHGHGFGFNLGFTPPGTPPKPGRPASPPPAPAATEGERLMILRMLEEKKITTEQAAKLLEALES